MEACLLLPLDGHARPQGGCQWPRRRPWHWRSRPGCGALYPLWAQVLGRGILLSGKRTPSAGSTSGETKVLRLTPLLYREKAALNPALDKESAGRRLALRMVQRKASPQQVSCKPKQ